MPEEPRRVRPVPRTGDKPEEPRGEGTPKKTNPWILLLDALLIVAFLAALAAGTQLKSRTDKNFLSAMDAAVAARYDGEGGDLAGQIETELAALEPFAGQSFYDKRLGELAESYLDTLQAQRELLVRDGAEYYYSDALAWYKASLTRNEIITVLSRDYGLLSGRPEIAEDYAASTVWQKALVELEEDLRKQLTGVTPRADETEEGELLRTVTYTNRTPYTAELVLVSAYLLPDGSYLYDEWALRLEPNGTAELLLESMPEEYAEWTLYWDIYDIYDETGESLFG